MERKKRIVIYGLGDNFYKMFTKRVADYLRSKFSIVGLVDKRKETQKNSYSEFKYCEHVSEVEFDYVCITSTKYYHEIKKELLEQSVDESRILPIKFWTELYQESYLPIPLFSGVGVEIGGPSDIFQLVYNSKCICDGVNYNIETVWGDNSNAEYKWNNKVLGKQIIADATNLKPIKDEVYDFVLSSNNLEHIANPLKAVSEFVRILKKDKPLIILVPCKENSFDHKRENTTFDHLLDDYNKETLEDDLTHLPEILEKHDLMLDPLAGTLEEFTKRSIDNYKNRCLHHHVYSNELLECIANYFHMEIRENTVFSNNYYLVAIKRG